MAESIQINHCEIEPGTGILHLRLSGALPFLCAQKTIRMSAVFRAEQTDRYYPLTARCILAEHGETQFEAEAQIQLNAIFYQFAPHLKEQTVLLQFQVCSPQKQWISFGEVVELPVSFFVKTEKRENAVRKGMRRIGFVFCTLLLPIWLLHGYLAVKGHAVLHPAARGRKGKSALLYHAHGLVSGWTGYGYSLREIKTNYFRRKYLRYCKKCRGTEGVLLLSERPVESGGNLDLIRSYLAQEQGTVLREFLESRPVHKLSWKELRRCAEQVAVSRVIVLEDFYPQLHALPIRKETKILQMWHACGAFKLFGLSELGVVNHLPQDTANHRNYDAALASSEGIVPFYSEAFGIPASHVKPIGVPRTDLLFDRQYRERVQQRLWEKYPVCRGRRVVLFAPTFRGSGNKTAYFPEDRFPVDQIMGQLPEDTVLVIKNHPFVKQLFSVGVEYRERVLDLSAEETLNDLLSITSVLVTDYSSSIFEAMLLRIPILFYAFDLDEYLSERDLYFDFPSFAPGPIVTEIPTLTAGLKDILAGEYEESEEDRAFIRFFLGALDGHSTERTVQLIHQLYEEAGREE